MSLNVDPFWLLAFLLAFVRAGAWLVVVPPFANRAVIPPMASVGVAGGLALLAAPRLASSALPTSTAGLVGAIATQVATGVALGLSVKVLLAAVTAAGSLVDLFGGLNLPTAIDPLSENQTPIFGQFYEQVAMVLLFITNGEMLLVRGFVASFHAPGLTLSSSGQLAGILTSDLATFFTAALEIAAPIIVVLYTAQIGLALVSRAAPQVNVWVLGMPVQALLSILFVAIGIKVIPGSVGRLLERAAEDMTQLISRR
ncbi:flagellar biosynthetic protein FliR [Acidiferrimicrobium sp. IK]|uniref:flagellar biosynthetic protein FliR n=1 Tax=Acidiferrimicrobium sp. IK TaxID=2871700 RepID=UPI0021CB9066|nr:flagellar biosynthetic protein FliR [Acidiferrimicrobium sp. IK]MCU4185014.1 flagellar biosynthetic protein FliR [Acidiferrimicrobium sp. IK]